MLIAWITAAIVTPLGLAAPDRLTAGPANQYLGAAAPPIGGPARELYFTSDEESTTQIYVQDLVSGVPRLAFDELADVTWPRPSPDGRYLLYISYREDAAGDLCLREIQGEIGARRYGARHCLARPEAAELQAVWFPDSRAVALVTRPGLHGDFELRRVSFSSPEAMSVGERVIPGSLSSPALSPDGRWLVTVPVARSSRQIGPSFLGKSAGALELSPLGDQGASAARLAFALPGASAMPAFSADGKWLYFTQFLNDTNFDGSIDGNDHGVLFRAPFSVAASGAGQVGAAEQLSSAAESCQYPVPAADRLLTTCLSRGSLDVFSLPPGGAIPAEWRQSPAQLAERIDDELTSSRDPWERLLLFAHRGATAAVWRQMIGLHLGLGELESAQFYAARLAAEAPAQRAGEEQREAGAALRELAEERRDERALERGALSAPFVKAARARLERLKQLDHPLATIAASEILDTLGEEAAARAALEPLRKHFDLDPRAPGITFDPLVASLYAERILALYRGEPRYFELYQPIAEQVLAHAEVFVRELLRGAAAAERAARIDAWRQRTDAYGEIAFLLELEGALAELTAATQEQVRERVFALYRKNKELPRRKALVAATVRRSLAAGNEYLLYNFAESWASYVPRQLAERRRAERLYRDAVFERAYVEEQKGKIGDARGHFYGVTLQTESLEAHAGFLEMRLAEGKDPAADYRDSPNFTPAATGYARAYLLARKLPGLVRDPAAHAKAEAEAIRELEAIAKAAPQRAEVHQLWAYIAYQRYLRAGDRLAPALANAHALLALDLYRDSPRGRAATLDLLGRVQAAVGNYGLALGWLEQRSRLPFSSPRQELSHCLAFARARYHTGDAAGASLTAERCAALTGNAEGEAARYRPLALDRAGLYALAAGDPEAAARAYAELWPLVEHAADSPGAPGEAARNRLTTRLGQVSAAIALGSISRGLPAPLPRGKPGSFTPPRVASRASTSSGLPAPLPRGKPGSATPPRVASRASTIVASGNSLELIAAAEALLGKEAPAARTGPYTRERPPEALSRDSYRLLLLGLRAQAHAQAGDLAAASAVLRERRDAVAARLKATGLDEDRLELALCEAQLASHARGRGAPVAEVLGHLTRARTEWRTWSSSTGTPVEDLGLAILGSLAELHLSEGVTQAQLGFDLADELGASYTQLSLVRNPAWEQARARFEGYLTTLNLRSIGR